MGAIIVKSLLVGLLAAGIQVAVQRGSGATAGLLSQIPVVFLSLVFAYGLADARGLQVGIGHAIAAVPVYLAFVLTLWAGLQYLPGAAAVVLAVAAWGTAGLLYLRVA